MLESGARLVDKLLSLVVLQFAVVSVNPTCKGPGPRKALQHNLTKVTYTSGDPEASHGIANVQKEGAVCI